MNVLAMDIGGSTRNGFCLMDTKTKEIIKCSYITYDKKLTKLDHRKRILQEVQDYYYNYDIDAIVFERVNLFKGGRISPLANIMSLCKVQCTIIDNMSDLVNIYDVPVKSWKVISLNNGNAKKEDSISLVQTKYPDVDLNIPKKRKDAKPELNHDLADAICIAVAVSLQPKKIIKKENLVNYK